MKETPERLALRLETEAEKTTAFFCCLKPEMWEKVVHAEDNGWNARQVLAHFVSSEAAFGKLIDDILQGGKGAPEDMVIDRFNQMEVAGLIETPIEELLATFTDSRARTVKRVKEMQESDLERIGRHPFLGMASLEEIIKLIYRHNQIHLREIRRTGLFDF
jgi:hypothetical protein